MALNINILDKNIHINTSFEKSWPYITYLVTKHRKMIHVNILCILIYIDWAYKNWAIKNSKLLYGKYEEWIPNPEYKDDGLYSFMFPPFDYRKIK